MNTPTKLAGFTLGLVAVFGAAVGVGRAVGPTGPTAGPAPHGDAGPAHAAPEAPVAPVAPAGRAAEVAGGLAVAERGYALDLLDEQLPAGPARTLAFHILGPDGAPVLAYDEEHEEDLHLIAVRRDLTGYRHVHPELGTDGTWRTPLALTPGSWRVFADFVPSDLGADLTLGADLAVPGEFAPEPLPEPSATAQVDGYTVTLDGALVPGRESALTLTISRDGQPVTDLQPYLGAYGHLVALRAGDLAYLHVHPADDGARPGPEVAFAATAPSAGDYRLFLDFRHGDAVHTAAFSVRTGQDGAVAPAPDGPEPAGHGHGG